jgi:hypothetical protein
MRVQRVKVKRREYRGYKQKLIKLGKHLGGAEAGVTRIRRRMIYAHPLADQLRWTCLSNVVLPLRPTVGR